MSNPTIDLFAEDRAHETFFEALVQRLAQEAGVDVQIQVRAARGGHGQAVEELNRYQRLLEKDALPSPDLVIVAIDANCRKFNSARKEVRKHIVQSLRDKIIVATPDPHIERWYLADPPSFYQVVGIQPRVGKVKCERDHYKRLLSRAIRDAGHIAPLGGIEFAHDIVTAMDLYRAGRRDRALGAVVDEMRTAIRNLVRA